jgi:hypothetical protein
MKDNKEKLLAILFFGSIWGIFEASIGYVLHLLPTFIAGTIMFPIGMTILIAAYSKLKSRNALLGVAAVAMAIKSIDFLLPNIILFKTLNPMIAILLEGAFVAVLIPFIMNSKVTKKFIGIIGASLLWRSAFVIMMFMQFGFTGSIAKYLATPALIIGFVIVNGLISALIGIMINALQTITAREFGNVRFVPFKSRFITVTSLFVALLLTYIL